MPLSLFLHVFFIRKSLLETEAQTSQNLKKILRKSEGSISKIKCFIGQKSTFHHYFIQNVKDGIQIQVYNINNGCLTHFSQFIISEKVERIEAQAKQWFSYKKNV